MSMSVNEERRPPARGKRKRSISPTRSDGTDHLVAALFASGCAGCGPSAGGPSSSGQQLYAAQGVTPAAAAAAEARSMLAAKQQQLRAVDGLSPLGRGLRVAARTICQSEDGAPS